MYFCPIFRSSEVLRTNGMLKIIHRLEYSYVKKKTKNKKTLAFLEVKRDQALVSRSSVGYLVHILNGWWCMISMQDTQSLDTQLSAYRHRHSVVTMVD